MKYYLRVLGILVTTTLLSACDGPYSKYNNFDLKSEYSKCDYNKFTAAGAQRCNNIKKECDLRKKESNFRC